MVKNWKIMTWGCLLTIVGPPRQWLCFCNSRSFSFLKIFNFALEYSRLTNNAVMVSGEQQRDSAIHTHASILPPNSPLIQAATYHWAGFHVLYSRSLLVIHFKYSSVYLSIPNSLTIHSPVSRSTSWGQDHIYPVICCIPNSAWSLMALTDGWSMHDPPFILQNRPQELTVHQESLGHAK